MTHFYDAHEAGAASPKSDRAPARDAGRGSSGNGKADNCDCAAAAEQCKRVVTAQARAALVGLQLWALPDGPWQLTYPAFGGVGHVVTVPSLQAAEGALSAFEQVHSEVLALIGGMRGAQ